MAGKQGQRSTKATQIPTRYAQGFLKSLDRRVKAARATRSTFNALLVELGGEVGLSLSDLATVERLAHLSRRIARIEEDDIKGAAIDQSALNHATMAWLGLSRRFQEIKDRRIGGHASDPLQALIDEEECDL